MIWFNYCDCHFVHTKVDLPKRWHIGATSGDTQLIFSTKLYKSLESMIFLSTGCKFRKRKRKRLKGVERYKKRETY